MAGTKFKVQKLGDNWAIYQEVKAMAVKLPDVFPSRDQGIQAATDAARNYYHTTGQSAEVWFEDMGRFVPHNFRFGIKP